MSGCVRSEVYDVASRWKSRGQNNQYRAEKCILNIYCTKTSLYRFFLSLPFPPLTRLCVLTMTPPCPPDFKESRP